VTSPGLTYCRWREDDLVLDFFLEYDTGTEPLGRVAAKLDDYARLTESTGIVTPVLFLVASERREANLRQRLLRQAAHMLVPTATGCRSQLTEDGPAGAVWLPTDVASPRCRLATLSEAWPGLGQTHHSSPAEAEGEGA
jgi:hypothetical protein